MPLIQAKQRPLPGFEEGFKEGLKEPFEETFTGKCKAFRTTLFPLPPQAPAPNWKGYSQAGWAWPSLIAIELSEACLAKIKGKTPGPDGITQEIIL